MKRLISNRDRILRRFISQNHSPIFIVTYRRARTFTVWKEKNGRSLMISRSETKLESSKHLV